MHSKQVNLKKSNFFETFVSALLIFLKSEKFNFLYLPLPTVQYCTEATFLVNQTLEIKPV